MPTTDTPAAPRAIEPPLGAVPVNWTLQFGGGLVSACYLSTVVAMQLVHTRERSFPVARLTLDDVEALGGEIIMSSNMLRYDFTCVIRVSDRVLARYEVMSGYCKLAVASDDLAVIDAFHERAEAALKKDAREANTVDVTFWNYSGTGANMRSREIVTRPWHEISGNYAPDTRAVLEPLMGGLPAAESGLIVWQGDPGTGKTTALRALVAAWRERCNAHLVIDPDVFLGHASSYLLDVVFSDDRFVLSTGEQPPARLIILEDAGELVSVDARARNGQAISRLLNLTDGLVGQGIELYVLITTNEPISRLHPAVRRPGRCVHHVQFEALSESAANAWLAERDVDLTVTGAHTIAELYELAEGRTSVPVSVQPLGFA